MIRSLPLTAVAALALSAHAATVRKSLAPSVAGIAAHGARRLAGAVSDAGSPGITRG